MFNFFKRESRLFNAKDNSVTSDIVKFLQYDEPTQHAEYAKFSSKQKERCLTQWYECHFVAVGRPKHRVFIFRDPEHYHAMNLCFLKKHIDSVLCVEDLEMLDRIISFAVKHSGFFIVDHDHLLPDEVCKVLDKTYSKYEDCAWYAPKLESGSIST